MESVLFDLYLFDGTAQVKNIPFSDPEKTEYYQAILKKHHLTQSQFDSSLVWYSKKPESFMKMQDKISGRLKKMLSQIQSGKFKKPIAPNDSLDSVQIKNIPRDFTLLSNQKEKPVFKFTDKELQQTQSLRISYLCSVQGNVNAYNIKFNSLICYTDSTRTSQSLSLILKKNVQQISFNLFPAKKKIIAYVKLNLLYPQKDFSSGQQAFLSNIKVLRIYNPYRK
jgi:hypothetical protein